MKKTESSNIQSLVQEPMIYMIAPSSSSPTDQLALVGDRTECLQELSRPVTSSNGMKVRDTLRFFCGDKPAQQFERGTQIGGTYKCEGPSTLNDILQGAQRVPTLLTLNPSKPLTTLSMRLWTVNPFTTLRAIFTIYYPPSFTPRIEFRLPATPGYNFAKTKGVWCIPTSGCN